MSFSAAAITPEHHDSLLAFLSASEWPFHAGSGASALRYRAMVDAWLAAAGTELWWLSWHEACCGLVRIFDLDDATPLFDLRVATPHRGHGIGTAAVRWTATHVFSGHPSVDRIEATTRFDNFAMRRALEKAGWVKESHWRSSWPTHDGSRVDGVGYGVLRSDWETGTTTPVRWKA